MNYLDGLGLHNVVLFKDAYLPLNHVGVTKIQGYNMDADKRNSKDNTNASGKSLLASCIAQIIVGSDAVTQDIKSRAKRDFFTEKDSKIWIDFHKSTNKVPLYVEKKAKGKSFDYVLKKDGKELKTRTIAYAEQKIRESFPYTEDEFYTLYYVDSRRPNALQFGTPIQRLEFITNLFKLNNYDEVRKLFNGLLSELKKDSIVLNEVEGNLSSLLEDMTDADISDLEKQYEELKGKQKKYSDATHDLYKVIQAGSVIKHNKKTMDRFFKLSKELDWAEQFSNEKELREHSKRVQKMIKELLELEKQAVAYDKYVSKKQQYDEQFQSLREKLSKYKVKFSKDDVSAYHEALQEAETLERQYKELKKEIADSDFDLEFFEKYIKEFKKKFDKEPNVNSIGDLLTTYGTDRAYEKRKVSERKDTVEDFRKLKDCPECPTCKQAVKKESLAKWIKEEEARIEKSEAKIKTLDGKIEKLKTFADLFNKHEEHKRIEKVKRKAEEFKKAFTNLRETLAEKKDDYDKYQKYVKYREQMDSLVLPEEVEQPNGRDKSALALAQEWMTMYPLVHPIYDKYCNAPKDIVEKAEAAEKEMSALKKKAADYVEKIAKVSSQLEVLKNNKSKYDKLKERKKELKKKTEDIPIVEMLIDAYSNKGVKLLIVKQIASIIEKNMNKFAPLLYKERIKFKFEVEANKFDILMERTYQRKKRISDVRRLSGAESRAFSFLLPLAILPLIPFERRLNIMVLDEPTVNLDYSMRTLFTNSFIPKLNSVIPHIIIVSPLDDQYKNQKVYTVVKEGGFSTLVAS